MKKIPFNLLFTALVILLLGACEDFIEIDLSKESIQIYAPANNSSSSSFTQQFKWEELKGASSYQLQIVKPDFATIQQFVLDTTTAETVLNYTLQPGTYQWRIRTKNGSSMSDFQVYTFTVDSSLDLSGEMVSLISPVDNASFNTFTQAFSWQPMSNADFYVFQILSGTSVISTQSPTSTTASYTFLGEGTYQWRVFAQNSYSSSAYSSRSITIDQTAPNAPSLSLPLANDTASNPVYLSWISESGVVLDSIYIYADTNLTTLVNSGISSTQSYLFSGIATQDYFWRVKSKDAAGNWGAFSAQRKFIVNP